MNILEFSKLAAAVVDLVKVVETLTTAVELQQKQIMQLRADLERQTYGSAVH